MKSALVMSVKQAGLYLAATLLMITSCKKDSDPPDTTIVSEEEAVEVITAGISAETGGLAEQTTSAARVAGVSARILCGQTIDTTYSGQNIPGATVTYNYNVHINRSLLCNAGIPQTFNFALDGRMIYATPRMSSDDQTIASFAIGGFQPGSSVYTFVQEYERNGIQQSKVRQHRSFSSKLVIRSTDVKVDKTTMKIISGTASVQFSGTITGGRSVDYSATLTFLGDRKGLLTLGNGNTYAIQW
ncbi:hypothetical protein LZZ85_19005 [Terrimonas sp. NA20]|uniref:Lipoprotein n=1 Tax=Terrimonas ginsenosidimutans TaxID=2908004 RepID=A0ABS9KVV6_9BACT|nr:hypothetical protein [Terrimonas ginsenosidimutans]MCG2616397.1 hypothetical protein [Terrimonas ginsenosidimutans]